MERQGSGRQLQKGKIPSVHDVAAVSSIIATATLLVLGGGRFNTPGKICGCRRFGLRSSDF